MTEMIVAGIAQADTVLLGSRTYAAFAQLWPKQGNDVPMANFLNNSPKYVVSGAPNMLTWQPATLIKGALSEELVKLKQKPGKDIRVPGSPRLVRSLLRDGLLDELSLSICPIVVGSGLRLFDEGIKAMRLKLINSRPFSTGAVSVTYVPLRPSDAAPERQGDFPEAATRK